MAITPTVMHGPHLQIDFGLPEPKYVRADFEERVPVNSDTMAEVFLLLSAQSGVTRRLPVNVVGRRSKISE